MPLRQDRDDDFAAQVEALFAAESTRLVRVLHRLAGEPELAADLVQEAFIRLLRRGSMPATPVAWVITVAMNLMRNELSTRRRRLRLLTPDRAGALQASRDEDPGALAERRRVRQALDQLAERDRRLLLLHAEGYRHRDIAAALGLHEPSVGTLLARARRAFRAQYEVGDASR